MNCAAHMLMISKWLILLGDLWITSVYEAGVKRRLKQILLDVQNKTYFKIKYTAHTHPNKSYIS